MNCQETFKQGDTFVSYKDMLYRICNGEAAAGNPEISRRCQELMDLLRSMPEAEQEAICKEVYNRILKERRQAFEAGVQAGIRLAGELHI